MCIHIYIYIYKLYIVCIYCTYFCLPFVHILILYICILSVENQTVQRRPLARGQVNFGMALTQPICDAILSTRLRFPAGWGRHTAFPEILVMGRTMVAWEESWINHGMMVGYEWLFSNAMMHDKLEHSPCRSIAIH